MSNQPRVMYNGLIIESKGVNDQHKKWRRRGKSNINVREPRSEGLRKKNRDRKKRSMDTKSLMTSSYWSLLIK